MRHGTDGSAAESGSGATESGGGSGATGNGGSSGSSPGGTGASGGSGGTSGTGEPQGDCYYFGSWFNKGETLIPEDDPCTSCICNNVSRVICGDRDCMRCWYEGGERPINESFPAKDGCNSCSCNQRGEVTCTHRTCELDPLCLDLRAQFANEVSAQKACPVNSRPEDECVLTALDSLPCGCQVAVHDASALEAMANEYFAAGCGQAPMCPPCDDIGGVAYCSRGTCVLGGYI